MAMTAHLFCEPSPNQIAHTSRSALFVTNPNYAHWAEFMVEAGMPTAANLVEATKVWSDDTEKNHTAYNLAMGTDLPFFDYLKKDKVKGEQFAGYMRAVTDSEGTKLEHLVNGYDWAGVGHGMVVDVSLNQAHYLSFIYVIMER
jgi:6-hydroxytryprostatin B O-methyltransferase